MFKFKPKFPKFSGNEDITTMSVESADDSAQEQIIGDNVTANYELFRAAGLLQDPFVFLDRAENNSHVGPHKSMLMPLPKTSWKGWFHLGKKRKP